MLIVLGSLNADLVFKAPSLPRPGETVLCPGFEVLPGGKGGNQAVAAARAGADVRFVGRVGDDEHGRFLVGRLAAEGIDIGGVAVGPEPTGVAVIAVDPAGENCILVASGANLVVTAAGMSDDAWATGTTLLCQNEIALEETLAALRLARQRGARTVLNMAPDGGVALDLLGDADVLVVNEIEAEALTGSADPAIAAERLQAGRSLAIVTLGGAGILLADARGVLAIPALPVAVVDTTGAGDTFVGVLAAGLDAGLDPMDAARRAIVASGLACTALGAQAAMPKASLIEAQLTRQG